MLDSEKQRELRNGKRYNPCIHRRMSENGGIAEDVTGNLTEIVYAEVSEIQILTQEAVNQQIKRFISALTRQLEELTRLVQGMVTTTHPSHYPKTDFDTTSGTATNQSDNSFNFF